MWMSASIFATKISKSGNSLSKLHAPVKNDKRLCMTSKFLNQIQKKNTFHWIETNSTKFEEIHHWDGGLILRICLELIKGNSSGTHYSEHPQIQNH